MFNPSESQVQAVSLVGAALILLGYSGTQFKFMNPRGVFYNVVNLVGGALLGYVALFPVRIGFVALESLWVLVSIVGLFRTGPDPEKAGR